MFRKCSIKSEAKISVRPMICVFYYGPCTVSEIKLLLLLLLLLLYPYDNSYSNKLSGE